MAFFFIPLTTITLAGLKPERIAAAAGLSNFVRITAGAMGTSIATTVWENRATLHHAQLTETLPVGSPALNAAAGGLTQGGLESGQAWGVINRLIDQQAFTRAADDVFWVSSVLFLVLIAAIWITRRPAGHGAGAAEAGGAH